MLNVSQRRSFSPNEPTAGSSDARMTAPDSPQSGRGPWGEHDLAGLCGPCVGLSVSSASSEHPVREAPSLGPPGSTEGSLGSPLPRAHRPRGPVLREKHRRPGVSGLSGESSRHTPQGAGSGALTLHLQQQTLHTSLGGGTVSAKAHSMVPGDSARQAQVRDGQAVPGRGTCSAWKVPM